MNRRQLLKTLALLPVTPVEKLLEPAKPKTIWDVVMAKHQRDLNCTVIRGGSRAASAIDKLEALRGGPDPAMLKKYQAITKALLADTERRAMETFYEHDIFSPEPKETKPPCTPS